MTSIEQMILWIEECEIAARDHDVARLVKLLAVINADVDRQVALINTPQGFEFPKRSF